MAGATSEMNELLADAVPPKVSVCVTVTGLLPAPLLNVIKIENAPLVHVAVDD